MIQADSYGYQYLEFCTHLAEIDFASHLGANVVTHSLLHCISRT